MISIGIDPDMTHPGIAAVDENKNLLFAGSMKVKTTGKVRGKKKLMFLVAAADEYFGLETGLRDIPEDIGLLVMEGQQIYHNEARNEDILNLGVAAGILMGAAKSHIPGIREFLMPTPTEWKGSVPKTVHQARICTKMGWKYAKRSGYCVPEVDSQVGTPGEWKHVLDAVGLALYGIEQLQSRQRRTRRSNAIS